MSAGPTIRLKLLSPVRHGSARYREGALVELPEPDAEALIACGSAERARGRRPAADDAPPSRSAPAAASAAAAPDVDADAADDATDA